MARDEAGRAVEIAIKRTWIQERIRWFEKPPKEEGEMEVLEQLIEMLEDKTLTEMEASAMIGYIKAATKKVPATKLRIPRNWQKFGKRYRMKGGGVIDSQPGLPMPLGAIT